MYMYIYNFKISSYLIGPVKPIIFWSCKIFIGPTIIFFTY